MSFLHGAMAGLAALCVVFSWQAQRHDLTLAFWIASFIAAIFLIAVMSRSVTRIRLGLELYRLRASATELGDGHLASLLEIKKSGLTDNDPRNACHLGAVGKHLLSYAGDSHLITVAPNNAGKTESVVIPNALSLSRNLIVTDKAGEVAKGTFKHRRDRLGHTIIAINPWRLHTNRGLPAHCFNPLVRLVALAKTSNPDILDEARGFADLLVPEDGDAGANRIFQDKGRELILWVMLHLAFEAAEGLDECSLPRLYQVLSSSEESVKSLFYAIAARPDRLGAEISRQGDAFLADYQRSSKTMGAYLNNAQAGLIIYSPAGHIGRSTASSDFDPAILKTGRTTVYIVAPPEQLTGSGGKWAAIVLYSLIRTVWAANKKYPRVLILADEFQNISQNPIPLVPQVLTVGRSFGIQLWAFVQDLRSFERYKDNATLFQSQAAIAQYWNVRNTDDAAYLEKRAGERGVVSRSLAEKDTSADASHSQTTIPALRAHQVMQLPAFTQLIVHDADPVMKADLISYKDIAPLQNWTDVKVSSLQHRFDLRSRISMPDPSPDHKCDQEDAA